MGLGKLIRGILPSSVTISINFKMKKLIFTLILIVTLINTNAQNITPKILGFSEYKIEDDTLGNVNFYLSKSDKKLPLLVYLEGSGAFPLFQKTEQGLGSTVVIDFQNLSKAYQILLISKPGVPFVDKVGRDKNGFPTYDAPKEYIEKLSLDWRVNAADKAIDYVLKQGLASKEKVIIFGFSEGAQVAANVAKKNKNSTHAMLFSGNGLNQLFDPIIQARLRAKTGQITEVEAQKEVDSLFKVYREIHKDLANTNKQWWGHSYKRWSSFTTNSHINCLVDLDIPIYMANGSVDNNSILTADYVQMMFAVRQKDNLTYKVYPNYDHQFNELIFDKGSFKQAIPKLQEVFKEGFNWLKNK